MKRPPNPPEIEAFIVEIKRIQIDDPFRDTINSVAGLAAETLELLSTLLRDWETNDD